MTSFSLTEAREAIEQVRPRLDEIVESRADLTEMRIDLATGGASRLGGLAEAKALEARIFALLEQLDAQGFEVKGYAPLLLDLPGERDGVPVRWCWLEGDDSLDWYHRLDCGFAGRRRI